jgi:hypothetical protein
MIMSFIIRENIQPGECFLFKRADTALAGASDATYHQTTPRRKRIRESGVELLALLYVV